MGVGAAITGLVCANLKATTEREIYDRLMTHVVFSSVQADDEPLNGSVSPVPAVEVAQAASVPISPENGAQKREKASQSSTSERMQHWSNVMLKLGVKNREKLLSMIDCESDGVEDVVVWDVHSNSYGILQFKMPTWNDFSKKAGVNGSPLNGKDAILVADWALSAGNGRHWSCF